jgi:hypothetical protein
MCGWGLKVWINLNTAVVLTTPFISLASLCFSALLHGFCDLLIFPKTLQVAFPLTSFSTWHPATGFSLAERIPLYAIRTAYASRQMQVMVLRSSMYLAPTSSLCSPPLSRPPSSGYFNGVLRGLTPRLLRPGQRLRWLNKWKQAMHGGS